MTDVVSEVLIDDIGHLKMEMRVLDLLIAREIHRNRNGHSSQLGDGLEGLIVSDEQIDAILSTLHGLEDEPDEIEGPFGDLIERERLNLHEKKAESLRAGVPLRLESLRNAFRLNPFEVGVIVVCMAPEIDLKYETLFSYLQDDVGRKRPTVNLPLTLLCSTLDERVKQRKSFIYPAPLIKSELIELVDDPYSKESSFLSHFLKISPRVVEYLLGSDAPDEALKSVMQVFATDVEWEHLILPERLKSRLQKLPQNLRTKTSDGARVVLQLVGSPGAGKKSIAKVVCNELGTGLLIVNSPNLIASEQAPESLIGMVIRESLLQNATIYFDNFHTLFEDNPSSHAARMALTEAIAAHDRLVMVGGETPWRPDSEFDDHMLINIDVAPPGFPERKQLWEINLNGYGGGISEDGIASISGKFRLNGGQIRRAVTTAAHNAWWRSGDQEEPSVEDLEAASRWHSNQRLSLLAKKIQPRYTWEDIVLPEDQKIQLREICGYFANIPIVYGQWGFQSKTSLGKGLNILFAGQSGTGKTMSAEIMATELGLDLYKIDLSGVISKYIGETEKNLDKIFREAQDSNAILFFDEADSLFGKRSEVRDSHDRYANIEISYLLQKMEEYQGIVILATNFRKNMDDAFVRRMHFAVEFPFPEEEYRREIWERVFPEIAPLDDSVDLGFIARQFKLAGGNIKNIAVGAAFLAAQQKESIRMEHLMWATKREHQKMGKLISEGDFGPYFKIVNR